MREVARRLHVTPMALYNHVANKQELLDGLVERLLAELPTPDPEKPWREQLDELAESLRATAKRYPDAFPLLLKRPAGTPAAKRSRETIYEALKAAGVPERGRPPRRTRDQHLHAGLRRLGGRRPLRAPRQEGARQGP